MLLLPNEEHVLDLRQINPKDKQCYRGHFSCGELIDMSVIGGLDNAKAYSNRVNERWHQ